MVEPTNCHDIADLLAEVATGAASGPDRARVLSHLTGCEDCRRELAELTKVADEVLRVAPEHQPPAGFESAVLARIAASADQPGPEQPASIEPKRRLWRPLAMAAAAVTIALAASGTVWQVTSGDRELAASYRDTLNVAHGQYFTAAPVLDSSGAQVGHVFAYQGEPSWVFAVLGQAPEPGTYDVVITTDDSTDTVAVCEAETTCSIGTTVNTDINQIDRVQLIAPGGTTLTATLTSWPTPQ